ncbi:MAG: hypothetical protein NXI10_05490 [bacterium]|nr:hypothetical protein [bacterium]
MAKSKGKTKGNIFNKYADAKGKGNIKNSALKMGVEGIVAAGAGAGVGALIGRGAAVVGVLGLGLGEYFGDQTNFSKVASASMIGYAIGSSMHSSETAKTINGSGLQGFGAVKEGAKQRLTHFKDSWMKAFFLDKLVGGQSDSDTSRMDDGTVGAVDMSEFDVFDEINEQEALRFEEESAQEEELLLNEGESEFEMEELPIQEHEFDQLNVQEIDALDGTNYEDVDFNTM